jgi:hypothetical protein
MVLLYFHPATLLSPGFRIYIELDAESSDVRPVGMARTVSDLAAFLDEWTAPPTDYPTAYDRVDDR